MNSEQLLVNNVHILNLSDNPPEPLTRPLFIFTVHCSICSPPFFLNHYSIATILLATLAADQFVVALYVSTLSAGTLITKAAGGVLPKG